MLLKSEVSSMRKFMLCLLVMCDMRKCIFFLGLLFLLAPKTNMDTQNDGLDNVSPFRYGHFWYLC